MNGFTIVIAILAVGLGLLIVNHESGRTFGLANEDFGHLVYMLPIAALLGAGVLAGRRGSAPEVLRNITIWLLVALVLVTGYLYRDEARGVVAKVSAGLLPGSAVVVTTSEGNREVIIHKSRGGHFQANVAIDGNVIPMLVDTGASTIVLAYEDAVSIGLNPASLDYSIPVMTANGRAMAAPVRLEDVSIGPISRRNIRALVAEQRKLSESLLGMSFLSTLSSLQIKTDELRLQD